MVQAGDWLKKSIELALLYDFTFIALGLPLVWIFDPTGEGAVFAGLMLAAFILFILTWFYLVLPRRLGMTLFALESLSPWIVLVTHHPGPTRVLSGFILWSVIELPMYGFELLGMLDRPGPSIAPRRPARIPTFLLVWFVALGIAYAISYVYRDSTPMTQYPRAIWAVAFIFLPIPPLIAARQLIRRIFPAGPLRSRES